MKEKRAPSHLVKTCSLRVAVLIATPFSPFSRLDAVVRREDVGEGGGSSKLSRNSSSSGEGGAEGIGADASSDDGEWSDSDEDDDTEGRADGNNAKRARTAP